MHKKHSIYLETDEWLEKMMINIFTETIWKNDEELLIWHFILLYTSKLKTSSYIQKRLLIKTDL